MHDGAVLGDCHSLWMPAVFYVNKVISSFAFTAEYAIVRFWWSCNAKATANANWSIFFCGVC
jgi:hypothetical protein